MLESTRISVSIHAIENWRKRIREGDAIDIERSIRNGGPSSEIQKRQAWQYANWYYFTNHRKAPFIGKKIIFITNKQDKAIFMLAAINIGYLKVVSVYNKNEIKEAEEYAWQIWKNGGEVDCHMPNIDPEPDLDDMLDSLLGR